MARVGPPRETNFMVFELAGTTFDCSMIPLVFDDEECAFSFSGRGSSIMQILLELRMALWIWTLFYRRYIGTISFKVYEPNTACIEPGTDYSN